MPGTDNALDLAFLRQRAEQEEALRAMRASRQARWLQLGLGTVVMSLGFWDGVNDPFPYLSPEFIISIGAGLASGAAVALAKLFGPKDGDK
jgi:hypothetical protein